MKRIFFYFPVLMLVIFSGCSSSEEKSAPGTLSFGNAPLYKHVEDAEIRWFSFENQSGEKGKAAMENKGAKGHPCDHIPAGESVTLMDFQGCGVIKRMWFTIDNRSPGMLRGLKFEIFWDGEAKPAVSAPFGDFFGVGLGQRTAMDNELFSDAEGRSFNCYIPMPFRKRARVVLSNETDEDLNMIFYDINILKLDKLEDNDMYFHCFWNRENPTELGVDYTILPEVEGKGRFLGSNIGIIANPEYESWWGEGEVKMYIDGDGEFPTLSGTGTEDYIGTAWGQGKFINRYTGCTVSDDDNNRWAFYRYHIPDPVYFNKDIRVTIQQIGGNFMPQIKKLAEKDLQMKYISMHRAPDFYKILETGQEVPLDEEGYDKYWVNFYRVDDWSSTAYFYLDSPVNSLPLLQAAGERVKGL